MQNIDKVNQKEELKQNGRSKEKSHKFKFSSIYF